MKYLPNERFPFDSSNLMGYVIAFALEYIILSYEYLIIATTLGLGIGAFWFAKAATKEFQRILHVFNEKAQAKKSRSNVLKISLLEFIYTHGIVKQLSRETSFFNLHNVINELHCRQLTISEWNMISQTYFNRYSYRFSHGVFYRFLVVCL